MGASEPTVSSTVYYGTAGVVPLADELIGRLADDAESSGFYEQVMATPGGARALSAARLRYEVLKYLHWALTYTGMSQRGLARRLGIQSAAVSSTLRGNGNLRVDTVAAYLHELGFELQVKLVPLGTARRKAKGSSG